MSGEKRNIGLILFPLSTALALVLFWEGPARVIGAASMLVLALGDASGALVGRRFGRRHYVVLGHQRSLEGSAAMFAASFLAVVAAFVVFSAPVNSSVLLGAVIAATVATGVEAVCPWGLDNLLIPVSVAGTMLLTRGTVWG
jgi:dolichol kinase